MGRRSRFAGAAAISIIAVVAGSTSGPTVTAGIGSAISMFWISASAAFDMLWRQLPDPLVVLAALPTAMAAAVLTLQGSTTALVGTGFGAATWALPLLVVHVFAPGELGFGDVKAASVVGAAVGLTQPPLVVAVGLAVAMAGAALVAWSSHRREVALGPCLAGAALACLAIAPIMRLA